MIEYIVKRLKGTDHRDRMMSRFGLHRVIITGDLLIPSLLKVFSNIVGVWPFIVVNLKDTRRRTDGDSLVV